MNRRSFLEFLGLGSFAVTYTACSKKTDPRVYSIKPSNADLLETHSELRWNLIAAWGDPINQTETYGYNNDFTCYFPDPDDPSRKGLLWVNHEYIDSRFINNLWNGEEKTQEMVDKERYEVGGSLIRVEKNMGNSEWSLIPSHENFRITATTPMGILGAPPLPDKKQFIGTLGNCAGGKTPWGTLLTAEENYQNFYGEQLHQEESIPSAYGWEKFYPEPPQAYGWIVEIHPKTRVCKKLTSLGRCAHECATVQALPDGRVVVYSGDDANDQCLYKFVSALPNSLEKGELFVANLDQKKWISLDIAKQPKLQEAFDNQIEVLTYLRKSADLVGGTKLDRPEDIAIDPNTGAVLVACTNNKNRDNHYGHFLKIDELGDYESTSFTHSIYLTGGKETGFACPDNFAFDPRGNLWFTTDISESKIGNEVYGFHGNNALFFIPTKGPQAGEVIRVANAPCDAELTGPSFTPDGRTLFLCVQHPGSGSKSPNQWTSTWPNGKSPKPGLVALTGPFLEKYSSVAT